jgi:hypothetical protein
MNMNLESAVAFVQNNGNPVELARLRHTLYGEPVPSEVLRDLFSGQHAEGGWTPFWAPHYSSLDATCFRLAQAEQLGVPASEAAVLRAISFLLRRQSPDGYWEEDEDVASSAPFWVKPGDIPARLYLTANCGYWMAMYGNDDQAAIRAADYLQNRLEPDGRLPSFNQANWLAGGLWFRLERFEAAEKVFAGLQARLTELPVSNLAWMMTTLLSAGVTAHEPVIQSAAEILVHRQNPDGSWAADEDSGQQVHVTLEVLRALRLCARI